jgi:hypothetical protein
MEKARPMAKSKRQMTQAKRAREQSLRERRERKQAKKRAAAALKAGIPMDQPADEAVRSSTPDAPDGT